MTSSVGHRAGVSALSAEQAALLASVVVNANDAVLLTEYRGSPGTHRIVYVNPAFTDLTGYSASEVLDRTPALLQGSDTCPVVRAHMRAAIEHRRSITVDIKNYRKDGTPYEVELRLSPVTEPDGTCRHWIAIACDISERHPREERHAVAAILGEKHAALLAEIKERERAEAQLAYRAVHDDLTGLYNRAYFMKRIDAAIARAQSEPGYTFSILSIDLDRFKLVNDYLGHRMGDRILRDLARRFEPLVGASDTIARLGGDEFGLLLEAPADPDAAVSVAGRLLMEISKRPSFRADDVVLAASIGIVHSRPELIDAEIVVRDADIALMRAREAVGNAYVVFTPEMNAEAEATARVRNDLYGAIERGEMQLFYQPLVDIATGGAYGFEGLVRWQHPTRGLVLPDEFVPAAEEMGLIVELGRWVLLEGCRKGYEFQQLAGRPLMISLNVSSQQLLHPNFLEHVQAALTASGIDPHTLQLEITESVFLAGGTVVGALFGRIRALGIQIAFDDFGTGYSSLSYLERFQIDALKIDRSFVARIHDASAKSEILRMIIALAHALGVDIVAEGVESRAQRDALGHLGCTRLQGYLFSGPLSAAAVACLLAEPSASGTALDALLEESMADAGAAMLSNAQRHELHDQVTAAIQMHHIKLDGLHSAVATGKSPFDLAAMAREDICPIGVWLNSTIDEGLRTMPLYYVTKSRHAVFHRSAARLLAAATARQPEAALSMRPDGDMTKVAASLLRTLHDWLAFATVENGAQRAIAPPAPGCE